MYDLPIYYRHPVHLTLTIDHELQTYRRCLLFWSHFLSFE